MANTKSAKKAVRSSKAKKSHNTYWKSKIKDSMKNIQNLLMEGGTDTDILKTSLSGLQKVLDKASKEKVIHKNKANRMKSRYAGKIAALGQKPKKSAKSKSK